MKKSRNLKSPPLQKLQFIPRPQTKIKSYPEPVIVIKQQPIFENSMGQEQVKNLILEKCQDMHNKIESCKNQLQVKIQQKIQQDEKTYQFINKTLDDHRVCLEDHNLRLNDLSQLNYLRQEVEKLLVEKFQTLSQDLDLDSIKANLNQLHEMVTQDHSFQSNIQSKIDNLQQEYQEHLEKINEWRLTDQQAREEDQKSVLQEISELKNLSQSTSHQVQNLSNLIQQYDDKFNTLNGHLNQQMTIWQEIQAQYSDLQDQVNNLHEQIQVMEKTLADQVQSSNIEELKNRMDSMHQKYNYQATQIETQLQEKIEQQAKNHQQTLQKHTDYANQQIDLLQEKVQDHIQRMDQQSERLEFQADKLKEQTHIQTGQAKIQEQINAKLQSQLNDLKNNQDLNWNELQGKMNKLKTLITNNAETIQQLSEFDQLLETRLKEVFQILLNNLHNQNQVQHVVKVQNNLIEKYQTMIQDFEHQILIMQSLEEQIKEQLEKLNL